MEKISKKGLYVHIPFCKSICSYCNFCKMIYLEKYSYPYLISLKKELEKYSCYVFDSIYIGGGTPTCLNENELQFLFDILKPYQSENCLITIETNPDIDKNKIKLLKKNNVKRISIGIQTLNKKLLKLINRNNDFDKIQNLIFDLRKNNIDDINLDLIYGFNEQSIDDLEEDLVKFMKLKPTHISTYCLQIEENTLLGVNNYKELNQDEVSKQYNYIVDFLKKYGYDRYEVSNFSKKGFESKHNLIYWNNQEYGGVGLSASSYINGVRRTNTKNLNSYLSNKFDSYEEIVNKKDEEFYFIMLGLRKVEGINLLEYENIFKKDFMSEYDEKIDKLIKLDDIEIIDNFFKVKEDKLFILDYILRILLF